MNERKNILFGNIKVKDKRTTKTLKDVVFKEGDTHYKGMEIIEIISSKNVGQTSITKSYTEVKANQLSKRDKMGGYE